MEGAVTYQRHSRVQVRWRPAWSENVLDPLEGI